MAPHSVAVATYISSWVKSFNYLSSLVYGLFSLNIAPHKPSIHFSMNHLNISIMRKHLYLLTLLLALTLGASAQKFALVDMQYILKNIPNYEMMNEQLETVSKRWQQEVQTLQDKAETLYKKYQSDLVFLTAEQKRQREEEIVKTEQQATELQGKYFGPEGELFERRSKMVKPLQDEIWQAIKEIASQSGFQLVLDRSTAGIVFANPSIDISDQVLAKLGYGRSR